MGEARPLLVQAGPAFLLLEGVLDPARIGEGHAVQLVDVAQAYALDVLELPARPQLDPVFVDADDRIVVPRSLCYGR